MTSVEKMLRTSCVPVLLDQSLPQHVTQIRQHQCWRQHRRLRQQKHHRLVVNSAVVVDVDILLQGQNLFAVKVGEEAEAQIGVLPMIPRWIAIWVVDIPWVGNEDEVVGVANYIDQAKVIKQHKIAVSLNSKSVHPKYVL